MKAFASNGPISAFAIFLVLLSVDASAQQWAPPSEPDPKEIMTEAENDVQEGRLGLAAEKYLWYFENAQIYDPSGAGVRLSYVLSDWRDLAEKHPPAWADIRRVRDATEEKFKHIGREPLTFLDLVAFNRVLEDDGRTIELFKWLDREDRHMARSVYQMAQGALVASGEFSLCERYIVGQNSFDSVFKDYKHTIQWLEERHYDNAYQDLFDVHHQMFALSASYIVAILVNLDRSAEAESIAEKALQSLNDETLRVQINDALEGIPPKRIF